MFSLGKIRGFLVTAVLIVKLTVNLGKFNF